MVLAVSALVERSIRVTGEEPSDSLEESKT